MNRQRFHIAVFLFFLSFTSLWGQDAEQPSLAQAEQPRPPFQPEWAFGVNAGQTISRINFNPAVSQASLRQFVGGLSARYLSERHFGLQAELNFSQRGWQEEKDSVPDHRFTKQLTYLELPVMTHIYFELHRNARLVFNMGPQISCLLSEKILKENIVIDPDYDTIDKNATHYTQSTQTKFDWGIAAGGGLEIRTGIGSFVLEGRYYYGLSDIYRNTKRDYFSVSSNQVLNVKLSYFFRK